MSLILPKVSRTLWAGVIQNNLNVTNPVYCRLTMTSITINADTVVGDLNAVQANFTGYAQWPVTGWYDAGFDVSFRRLLYGLPAIFTRTAGSNTIYAAYLTNGAGTQLWGVEEFSVPITVDATNPVLIYIPPMSVKSQF